MSHVWEKGEKKKRKREGKKREGIEKERKEGRKKEQENIGGKKRRRNFIKIRIKINKGRQEDGIKK